ncbi:GTP-binding protein REM 1 isoform X2 [Pan troglodytes]|uniref:GTP-binding protein REM 1 isoform X2 n=1 Tax=Pan troglodytes TaxID=9598 RepID=UPI0023F4E1E1|nr:GTP-binding protein REM 1 isoform X2 [Pan troglodytes]
MTLNTEQEAKTPLHRRASTPLPLSPRGRQPGRLSTVPSTQSQHPRLGQSASLNPPTQKPSPAPDDWSSESSDSEGSWEALYRVVLLGDPGVGKTSLASLFAGKQERDLHEQLGEDVYERTLTVDGEDTTLVVVDTWEAEKLDKSWSQESCLQGGSAYVIVYSIADRGSFESASELRIQLRRTHQADHVPIILVGNKADLARCREVSVEEETKFCCVAHDGLKLLSSRDAPTSTSQGAEISGISHWVPPCYHILRPCRNQDLLKVRYSETVKTCL